MSRIFKGTALNN